MYFTYVSYLPVEYGVRMQVLRHLKLYFMYVAFTLPVECGLRV
jgi:hypothetical protein